MAAKKTAKSAKKLPAGKKLPKGKSAQGELFAPAAPAAATAATQHVPHVPDSPAATPDVDATKRAVEEALLAEPGAPPKKRTYATAESMAKAQREISVSEFFAKNRHLLGFDNPRKALLTTVKEAVDNSLDACEEAGIMPVVRITIEQVSETHFRVIIQDNGPGIVKAQIPSIFGRLLYGSKFHRLQMSRGQQGIGISAAGMYGLLTTGKPVKITSRTGAKSGAHYYELQIDTRKNRPDIMREESVEWDAPHGTKVEIELEAKYLRGRQSVDDYLEQTAIANPHVTVIYKAPDGTVSEYKSSVAHLPAQPKSIRPHPHGIELGVLIKMAGDSKAATVQQFLTSEFSRVSPRVAQDILAKTGLSPRTRPNKLTGEDVKSIYQAIQATKIMAPATDCVVPIGEEALVAGLKQVVAAEFYSATSRSPAVYRGNPFIIEAALAFGKPEGANGGAARGQSVDEETGEVTEAKADEEEESQLARLLRFANRVPLLYQQSACAIYKAVAGLNWRSYGLQQSRGALPTGPLTVVLHMASVWVPFTSESKEAIALYPEILKEIRLALQDCGRKLGMHIRRNVRLRQELKKRGYIEKYIPAIGEALRDILELKDPQVTKVCDNLRDVLERSRKM
ncbi:MAG: DNA topoisomerase VI subunit B [Planctomycetaceae bacterium]|nr:DNA topoisomerase VI subunit B [Planctomycetaceae bacterium]